MKKTTLEMIDRLIRLPQLDPAQVADCMSRRPLLVRESPHMAQYQIVGGASIPFQNIELRWSPEQKKGVLFVRMADGVQLSMKECVDARSPEEPSLVPGDPRMPEPEHMFTYSVPIGELRLSFLNFTDRYTLRTIVIDQFQLAPGNRKRSEEDPDPDASP